MFYLNFLLIMCCLVLVRLWYYTIQEESKTNVKLVEILNEMISLCEPVKYTDFNVNLKAKNISDLQKAEKINPEIGIANSGKNNEGISTLSIIATITDILIQKRLAFIVEENGIISGVNLFPFNLFN